jgi:hypothetical protein
MAVDLTLNILDGTNYPTLELLEATGISIVINGGASIDDVNTTTQSVTENTFVTIVVSKTGYDDYNNTVNVLEENLELNIVMSLSEQEPCDFLEIQETSCHIYTLVNSGTTSDDNVTFTITDLDYVALEDYTNIELNFESSTTFTAPEDNVYLAIFRNTDNDIICQFVIIDLCTILSCVTNRIQDILCHCDCEDSDCTDYCKKDYDLKRIFLLGFDLFNRVNREYRLNSFYTTIDQAKITELKDAADVIEKLNSYCSECGDTDINFGTILSPNINPDCGCS